MIPFVPTCPGLNRLLLSPPPVLKVDQGKKGDVKKASFERIPLVVTDQAPLDKEPFPQGVGPNPKQPIRPSPTGETSL